MKIILCFLISVFSFASKQKVTLGTFLIPRYVKSSTEGEFIKLVTEISEELDIDIEIVILPPKRTVMAFENKKVDGYFPALDVFHEEDEIYKSTPYYYKKDFLFYRENEEISLKEKNQICFTHGYPYKKDIINQKNITQVFASSDEACLEMLSRKRVDGFICEGLTGISAIEKLNQNDINMSPIILSSQDVYFAFSRDDRGRELSEEFTKVINSMRDNGRLKSLFAPASTKLRELISDFDPTAK